MPGKDKVYKLTPKNCIRHFVTVTQHRHLVRRHCFAMGLYLQGLTHDLSKYTPLEFITGVRYYQGDRSPLAAERELYGFSKAWLHHKGRNKHHFEYWVDFNRMSKKPYLIIPVRMPDRYIAEMVADRVAASKTYRGDEYSPEDPLRYYKREHAAGPLPMHPYTEKKLRFFLEMIAEKGEEYTFRYIRRVFLRRL